MVGWFFMKAIVKTKPEEDGTEMLDVPKPKAGDNDVLVKVKYASICGTDVHIYEWDSWSQKRIKTPLIYGHEFAGKVVKTGKNVKNISIDDFVSGECHIACNNCYQCRTGNAHVCEDTKIFGVDVPGIFAEYAVIPASNIWKNDPNVPQDLCSIQDPLGNAVHTVFSTDIVSKDIAITGLGPIGAMAVAVCKQAGAKNVFAIGRKNTYRIDLAEKVGADYTFKAGDDVKGKIMEVTDGQGVDAVLEMSGNTNAVLQGIELLKKGGTISLLGIYDNEISFNLTDLVFKYATVKGINGRLMYDTWYKMKGLLNNKDFLEKMKQIVTHRFKFDDFQEAMKVMRSGNSGKVVLELD